MTATVDFRMIDRSSHFLDPRCNFQPFVDKIHVRFDPLTGRSCHFSHAGAVKLQKVNPKIYERPEIKGFCPFCKDGREDRVPQYPDELFPGGRLTRGEAFLFPDLYPYDQFNAVTVMTDDHVVPLEDFTERRLLDSFSVGNRIPEASWSHASSCAASCHDLELHASVRGGLRPPPSTIPCD